MRIGIVGSESSHAMQFAKFYNLPDPETGKMRFEDIRVTAIMGDAESAGETARQADIPHIATTAEEMADMVDAVMITSRRGSEHLMQARPLIAKGMPMFVDKPFTSDVEEAVELASAIEKAGCPVLGGSGCKYSDGVLKLKEQADQLRKEGKLLSAMLHFPIMLDSPYDGFWFYAHHLVEICTEIFGTDIRAVQAIKTDKALIANVQYPDVAVSLHFVTEVWTHSCTFVSTGGPVTLPLITAGSLDQEATRFAGLLHGEYSSMTAEELIRPVAITDAILRAEATGATIVLN
jgi:hypothetical protein